MYFFLSDTLAYRHHVLPPNCSEINNKLTNTRQHNKYLWGYIGYIFLPVNWSSPGLQHNKSQVLFRYWDPINFAVVNVHKIWYG